MRKRRHPVPTPAIISLMIAFAVLALPLAAMANTTADTKVVNIVRVDYKDASKTQTFAAEASAAVTINLVEAALNASGPPTNSASEPALSCLATSAASGSSLTALYALTAKANGDDTYDLSIAQTGGANVTAVTLNTAILNYNGATLASDPASYDLGSAVAVGYNAATYTMYFPGGALAGFQQDDIVVVQGKSYLVDAVDPGTAPAHTNNSQGTEYSATGTETTEVQGYLTLKAYPSKTILGNTVGGTALPTLDNTVIGTVVAEQILLSISVKATVTTTSSGTVNYTFTATPDGSSLPETITCTANFSGTSLNIKKEARVSTDNTCSTFGSFGASTANPGYCIEYQVTVQNTGSTAEEVVVTDAVPFYTTLQDNIYSSSYFATVNYNSASSWTLVNITLAQNNSEDTTRASGGAAGTGDGSAITFYLGNGNVGTGSPTGGAMGGSDSAVITYRVKID